MHAHMRLSVPDHVWTCTGTANSGYTPHVAARSPIVTFQANILDNRNSTDNDDLSYLFPLFPAVVLDAIRQPDLTAIILDFGSDDDGNGFIITAVAFNGVPQPVASRAAAAFAKRLNASAGNSSQIPFASPSSFTIQQISNVNQSSADEGRHQSY